MGTIGWTMKTKHTNKSEKNQFLFSTTDAANLAIRLFLKHSTNQDMVCYAIYMYIQLGRKGKLC